MNIEITENIIRGSIVKQIKTAFPDITCYDEIITEGFERPSFHVLRVDNIMSKGYQGSEYKISNNDYRYEIKYFPEEKYGTVGDINNKIDKLKETFDYLKIVNIDGENIYEKTNRINDITVMVVDGVLLFQIQFNVRTMIFVSKDKVQAEILTVNGKNI